MHNTTDTTPEAEAVQLASLRAMSGQDRIRQTCVLSTHLRTMAFRAIRRRFPEICETELKLKFIEMNYGKSLADAIRCQMAEVLS
jgi:hypothetical protein